MRHVLTLKQYIVTNYPWANMKLVDRDNAVTDSMRFSEWSVASEIVEKTFVEHQVVNLQFILSLELRY